MRFLACLKELKEGKLLSMAWQEVSRIEELWEIC